MKRRSEQSLPGPFIQPKRKKRFPAGGLLLLLFLLVLLAVLFKMAFPGDPPEPSLTTVAPTFAPTTTPTTTSPTQTTTKQAETSATVPVQLSTEQRQQAIAAAGEQVRQLIEAEPHSRIGVFFLNLTGAESWSYQDEMPFVAASSIKLGFNTLLYEKIAAGLIDPDEILTYDSRPYPQGDYEAGTGTIQSLPNGSTFTVKETSQLSIRISDNCATNMVLRRLDGIDAVNPWLNQISGIVDYRQSVRYNNYAGQAQSGRHRTCARDLGKMAELLYNYWIENPDVYSPLIDDLCQTEFDFGIQKGVPDTVKVAHKIGTNGIYSTENDVGIVFTAEPFVLCVTTEMASAARARQLQAEIALIFYLAVADWP